MPIEEVMKQFHATKVSVMEATRAYVSSILLMPTVKYLAISMFSFFDIFFISWSKRGDGFHIGFQKNGKSIFYGSSVRMGHKVYIFPILLDSRVRS